MQFTFTLYYLTTSALKRLHRLGVRMLLRWVSLHPFPVYPAHNSARLRIPVRELPEKLSAAGGALGHLCGSAHGWTSNTAENRGAKGGKGERRTAFVESAAGGATCSGVWCDLLTPPSLWTSSRDESKVLFGVDRPKWQLTHGRVTIAFGENPFLYLIPGSCARVCVKSYVGTAAEPLQEALLMQKWGEDFVVVFLPHRFN